MLIPMDRLQAEYGVAPTGVLHVGAHLGEEAAAYASAGVERVLWVEANPHLMDGLRSHVASYPGQTAVQAAVSDVDGGTATLHLASFSMSSSLLPPKEHLRHYPSIYYPSMVEVATTTVDALLRSLKVDPAAFQMANLDIEGAELLALHGMQTVLPHLEWLYLEVNHEEMYAGCALLGDVDAYLAERGFDRVAIVDAEIEGRFCGWADAIFVRRREGSDA